MNEKAVIVWLIIVTGLLVLSMVVCLGAVAINKRQEQDIRRLNNNLRILEDYVDELLMEDERKNKKDMVYSIVMEEFMRVYRIGEAHDVRSKEYMELLVLDAAAAYDTMDKLYKNWEAKDEEENDS